MSYIETIIEGRQKEIRDYEAKPGDWLTEVTFSECCSYDPHSFYCVRSRAAAEVECAKLIERHAADNDFIAKLDELEKASKDAYIHIDLGDCVVCAWELGSVEIAEAVAAGPLVEEEEDE